MISYYDYPLDRYRLCAFGANIEDAELMEEYSKWRTMWVRAREKGELPKTLLMLLANKYQVTDYQPEPEPVEVTQELLVSPEAPPKRKRGRPRKVPV